MQLTDIYTLRQILHEFKIFAQKKLGQHFLVDQKALDKIIETAQLKSSDAVLEIGPGLGTLTRELSSNSKKVVAIEKDPEMIKVFKSINSDLTGVLVLQKNALTLQTDFFQKHHLKNYKLVANLPYYLTSAIIRFFLENQPKPQVMVLMVQKEVAERIVGLPPDANLLSVAVQFYGEPEIVQVVPKESFWPQPKVDSAIIKITPHQKSPHKISNEKGFFRIVRAGFGEKRKQLHNSLAGGLNLPSDKVKTALKVCKIASQRRAETLTLDEWIKIYNMLS